MKELKIKINMKLINPYFKVSELTSDSLDFYSFNYYSIDKLRGYGLLPNNSAIMISVVDSNDSIRRLEYFLKLFLGRASYSVTVPLFSLQKDIENNKDFDLIFVLKDTEVNEEIVNDLKNHELVFLRNLAQSGNINESLSLIPVGLMKAELTVIVKDTNTFLKIMDYLKSSIN